ncbi:MAG TPA: hypothetical protein VK541_14720 [Pedobacter sp.]|uniref:hypothetical protein n=1 Tax=Pedobacter sp. TaxID=1411316 RepID=UPI002CDC2F27|nr:hypothetical protein [Pedobacter sp.]HMI03734.1 hypothetical protein [Pedobacter sp.]
MTWVDKLDHNVFTITTGDGKVYKPLWKSGETSKEFNATIFDFINIPGSLIDRKSVRARKFPLIFWFSGADNIEQADAFDQSANDNRSWKVSHPFYGDIIGQPISLARNDTGYNSTEITVDFWETITDTYPKKTVAIADSITSKSLQFRTISPVNYASKVDLKPADVSIVKDNAEKINLSISALLDSSNYSEYQLAKNDMFGKVDNLILSPVEAIASLNDIILLPAKFLLSVNIRINLIKAVYESIKSVLFLSNKNNKAYFESNAGAAVMGLSNVIVNPAAEDYVTRKEIVIAAEALSVMYKDYLVTLDNSYVSISDPENSFSASNETQSKIQDTVVETISNLGTLAFSAKQERITILETDSNLILLTHKYLGLDQNDENIEKFRVINNIKNRSLFLIKKGRSITYYV